MLSTRPDPASTPATAQEASIGLYIHIPWCRSICSYCDFDRQAHAFELIPSYLEAVIAELKCQPSAVVHSIFFGGGTPSLLSPVQLASILDASYEHFEVLPVAEITVEANPGDLDSARVADYLSAGVTRLSLGVQSFDDQLLRLLHRRHSAADAVEAIRQARLGGARNLSFDLMYALPGQSPAHWHDTLRQAVALEPEHLSAYLLTIDDRVPLGRQVSTGRLVLPDDDATVQMYEHAQSTLDAAGLEQYEISNWAQPGRQSRHNLTYWRDEPYIGLGAGAASSFRGRRYKNVPDPARYLASVRDGNPALIENERPSALLAALDHLALRLRLREGLDTRAFQRRFGLEFATLVADELPDLLRSGLLEQDGSAIRVGRAHFLVSNEIILRLLQAMSRHWPAA
jgi:oxygen-independent coproporphyrinogen III oxidase